MIKKLSILILSMIMIISCSKNNPNDPNNDGTTPELPTTSINFDEVFLKFETDNKTVPTFTFFKDEAAGTRKWEQSSDGTNKCYIYNAPDGENGNETPGDTPSAPLPVVKAKIYVYRGINPFKTEVEDNIEKQFYFYRYTGYALMELPNFALDNFLVAVDTKTGYVFPYAVPEKWKSMMGVSWAPDGWISAELGKTGKPETADQEVTFEAHKFWQYDPIGIVNDDGTVTLEQFYIDAQSKSDYKPVYRENHLTKTYNNYPFL